MKQDPEMMHDMASLLFSCHFPNLLIRDISSKMWLKIIIGGKGIIMVYVCTRHKIDCRSLKVGFLYSSPCDLILNEIMFFSVSNRLCELSRTGPLNKTCILSF